MGCSCSEAKKVRDEQTANQDNEQTRMKQEPVVVQNKGIFANSPARDPQHVFVIMFTELPFGMILTSQIDGTCAYVTATDEEKNKAVKKLPINSKLLQVNDQDVEMEEIPIITRLIIKNAKTLPLRLTFCHPSGLLGSEFPDPNPKDIQDKLVLKAQDGQTFEISRDIAMQSELVKTMWEGDKDETEIPLPNVKPHILDKVIEYMKYHHSNPSDEIEKPLKSANLREVVSEWDASFVEIEQEHLFELILAANYMDIKPLLDLTCAKVASMIKGKSPEEIRQKFNIKNDFTPEEEEAIRAENKWAEDS